MQCTERTSYNMYYITVLVKFPKLKRFPLQGNWQNVALPFNIPQPKQKFSASTNETMSIEPKTLGTVTDAAHSTVEMLYFLPDVDIERSVFEEDDAPKIIARETNPASSVAIDRELGISYAARCGSVATDESESDDSD
uniref:Uncharacterized protein n=1 Tax=Anopheles minimus TaxID=112268 RepID=A0A182VTG3_9DIPT